MEIFLSFPPKIKMRIVIWLLYKWFYLDWNYSGLVWSWSHVRIFWVRIFCPLIIVNFFLNWGISVTSVLHEPTTAPDRCWQEAEDEWYNWKHQTTSSFFGYWRCHGCWIEMIPVILPDCTSSDWLLFRLQAYCVRVSSINTNYGNIIACLDKLKKRFFGNCAAMIRRYTWWVAISFIGEVVRWSLWAS